MPKSAPMTTLAVVNRVAMAMMETGSGMGQSIDSERWARTALVTQAKMKMKAGRRSRGTRSTAVPKLTTGTMTIVRCNDVCDDCRSINDPSSHHHNNNNNNGNNFRNGNDDHNSNTEARLDPLP